MIRVDAVWLALGASDLRGGIDRLLAMVVHGFALGAQPHHAYVFANRRADRLKVLVYDGAGLWLCTRRLQAGGFAWPREDTGQVQLSREQLDWLVAGLPWQRLSAAAAARAITVVCAVLRCAGFAPCVQAIVHWRMSRFARTRARETLLVMLDASSTSADAPQAAAPAVDVVQELRDVIERMQAELQFEKTRNEALNFEIARLKRWRFGSSSESLDGMTQAVLFDAIVADTEAEDRAAQDEAKPPAAAPRTKGQAVRQVLPESLPRIERRHEIEATHCECGQALQRIGEEVSEQLDCVPAQFFVLRHIRGKYACACCQSIQAAPMPAQIIDKGIPAPGLLAQVVVAKHDDHLPLYRQTEIYARCGVHIPRSSMAQWIGICGVRLAPLAQALKEFIVGHDVVHADETPIKLLAPGKGKTAKAYVWVYRTTNFVAQRAVLYDFSTGRGGENARRVLEGFTGTLVSDDFSGYHALQAQGVTAALCMAHARRKLFEAHQFNGSAIAGHAVALIAKLYELEREARQMHPEARRLWRQQHAKPLAGQLHAWLIEQRPKLARADVTARAIDYALSNWAGLTRYLNDGNVPIDNNAAENAVRPLAVGRKNWLFVGSQQAGERAAVVLSLIESAKLNGHDPWAYLKDVFERLPTLKQRDLAQLLPHNWRSPDPAAANVVAPVPTTA